MTGRAEAILNAAEIRIRDAGYNGFSFRDLATDVGVKSSSVHFHFPTKEALVAAVVRRYVERLEAALDEEEAAGAAPVAAWRTIFRRALINDGRMCLCGVLATEIEGLPPEVAEEARRFFTRGVDRLVNSGAVGKADAIRIFAMLEGAMVMAKALDDPDSFDMATSGLR